LGRSANDDTFCVRTSSASSRTLANAISSRFFGALLIPADTADIRIGFRWLSHFIPGNNGSKSSAGSTEFGMCSA
jgi:hypothetical protein